MWCGRRLFKKGATGKLWNDRFCCTCSFICRSLFWYIKPKKSHCILEDSSRSAWYIYFMRSHRDGVWWRISRWTEDYGCIYPVFRKRMGRRIDRRSVCPGAGLHRGSCRNLSNPFGSFSYLLRMCDREISSRSSEEEWRKSLSICQGGCGPPSRNL